MNFSTAIVPFMICSIIGFGIIRKVRVYEVFVEGAFDGIKTMFNIIAPLLALMVAIAVFRESGALDMLAYVLKPITDFLKIPDDVLPLALLRSVSGSGSLAIVNDIFKESGPDSISGKIASVMMGSNETTIYTIAVYYGAVGIKNIRHTLKSALLADFAGVVISVYLVYAMMM